MTTKTSPSRATRKAATTKATAKGTKATATKATATKATATKGTAKGPKAEAAPVLETKSGVPHPCVPWAALIEKSGQTQTATARAMGVAPMTMSRLMRGHGIPTANITIRFAEATGANVRKCWQQVCDYELALALEQAEATKK